jgi:hypothetical protein
MTMMVFLSSHGGLGRREQAVLHDLEHDVEHVLVGLLDLVEEDDA